MTASPTDLLGRCRDLAVARRSAVQARGVDLLATDFDALDTASGSPLEKRILGQAALHIRPCRQALEAAFSHRFAAAFDRKSAGATPPPVGDGHADRSGAGCLARRPEAGGQ